MNILLHVHEGRDANSEQNSSACDMFLLSLLSSSEAKVEGACPPVIARLTHQRRELGKVASPGEKQQGPMTPSPRELMKSRGVSALPQAREAGKSEQTGKVPEAGQAGTRVRLHNGLGLTWQSLAVILTPTPCQSPSQQ
jgi:hypothetical protein